MSPNGVSTGNDSGYQPVSTASSTNREETTKGCPSYDDSKLPPSYDESKLPPSYEVSKLSSEAQEKETSSASSDTQSDTAGLVVPPDGGWGWVVVAGSFACNMIVDGIIFAFGMFLDDIATTFGVSTAYVSLVGALLSGFYLMVGPFTSALANRYGFRLVAILGSFLAAIAFVLSYFATSVMFLCITYGIIGGIGFGFIYVPAVITVGFYFEKWRALATGIGVCGSGIGTFVFAPICAMMVKSFGWRYSFVAQGFIILFCALFGATFRPLKPTKLKDLKNKEDFVQPELVMDSSILPTATRLKMEKALENMKANSSHSLNENQSTIPRILGVNNNASYPTAAEVCNGDVNKVYHTISVPQHQRIAQLYNQEKRRSVPLMSDEDVPQSSENGNGATPLLDEKGSQPIILNNRRHTISEKRPRTVSESNTVRNRKDTLTATDVNRPLYRDDIFFGASLTRLPQYTSQTSVAYNLSVMRLPTKNDVEEEIKQQCRLCPESVRRPLANMLDISLLKSPSFLVLAISGALTMMGFYVPFMFMKERAILSGMDTDRAVWLISAIGIANTIGRVASGLFSSLPDVNVLLVNNVAISVGGIATILSGLSASDEYQFTYATIFGLSISCFASLRSILVVELLGLERLTNAFGLLLLFQGIAACIGAPMAGEFYSATGSYDYSFYLSGSLILASAIMCYPLNVINRWEKRKLGIKDEKPVPV